jgi:hypothetical protein
MIILKETDVAQTFSIIPRAYGADSMVITNETSNIDTTYAITATQVDYYLSITKIIDLTEGNFYTLKVLDGTDIVYKDKIFCTNQVVENYTINKDEYTEHTTNNDYIVYE